MAEWLFEAGIGEDRAALVEQGVIAEIRIDRHDRRPRAGAVVRAKLVRRHPNSDRASLTLPDFDGQEAVGRIPGRVTEGRELLVSIVREAIPERGNAKPPIVKPADGGAVPQAAPALLEQLRASGQSVRQLQPHEEDLLEAAGWSEHLAEAESGLIAFPGGLLRMSLTPAMTLFDIDGTLAPAELSIAGASATAAIIWRFDIGGSIGVDLPVPQAGGKALRSEIAAEVDRILPQPFERTAVNGFGFLQIVRRRIRPSLPELLQSDAIAAAALALLRRGERVSGRGAVTLSAAPSVVSYIRAAQGMLDELARRRGASVHLSERPGAAISDSHVQTEHP